jgi:hypothetical protein
MDPRNRRNKSLYKAAKCGAVLSLFRQKDQQNDTLPLFLSPAGKKPTFLFDVDFAVNLLLVVAHRTLWYFPADYR